MPINVKCEPKHQHVELISRVPTATGKMGEHFPVKEKSGNLNQTGKVKDFTQNTGKV